MPLQSGPVIVWWFWSAEV